MGSESAASAKEEEGEEGEDDDDEESEEKAENEVCLGSITAVWVFSLGLNVGMHSNTRRYVFIFMQLRQLRSLNARCYVMIGCNST